MTRNTSRRRLRVRRRRKHDRAADVTAGVGESAGSQVVAEYGCCVVEAVGAVSIFVALSLIPTYFLLS